MKREKRLTKKERKLAQASAARSLPRTPARQHGHAHQHIHCIACGKHLDISVFGEPDGADFIRCEHGSDFAHCIACTETAKELVAEHDRTNQPVRKAAAWH